MSARDIFFLEICHAEPNLLFPKLFLSLRKIDEYKYDILNLNR